MSLHKQPRPSRKREHSRQRPRDGSHEHISRILESITDAFISLDRNWNFTYVNGEAQRLLHKSAAELLGTNVWQDFPDADAFRRRYEQVIARKKVEHFEEYYAPLATWFEVHAYPSGDGISIYFRDINQRKRAEQALRDSEADLKHAQAVARTGSWRLDVRRNELAWSDETYRIFGIPQGTPMTYETFLAAVHPDDRALVDRKWQAALGGAPYEVEHRIVVGGEVRWVREKAELEFDGNGELLGGFGAVQDITERKQTEQALMRAEKLASAGRVAATLAHEINNPLAAVMNALYIVSHEPSLPEPARKLMAVAERELKRAAQITKRTLGLYREPSNGAQVAVAEVVDELTAIYEPRLRECGIQLEVRIADPAAVVVADAGELRQVLSNLLVNAIDAVGECGRVYIRVRNHPHICSPPAIRITVADSGSGIELRHMKHIFEPFFTTKKDVGTGLGLWISEQIVHKYVGSMRVRSRVGRGTVFSILLPAAASSHSATAAAGRR